MTWLKRNIVRILYFYDVCVLCDWDPAVRTSQTASPAWTRLSWLIRDMNTYNEKSGHGAHHLQLGAKTPANLWSTQVWTEPPPDSTPHQSCSLEPPPTSYRTCSVRGAPCLSTWPPGWWSAESSRTTGFIVILPHVRHLQTGSYTLKEEPQSGLDSILYSDPHPQKNIRPQIKIKIKVGGGGGGGCRGQTLRLALAHEVEVRAEQCCQYCDIVNFDMKYLAITLSIALINTREASYLYWFSVNHCKHQLTIKLWQSQYHSQNL